MKMRRNKKSRQNHLGGPGGTKNGKIIFQDMLPMIYCIGENLSFQILTHNESTAEEVGEKGGVKKMVEMIIAPKDALKGTMTKYKR